jgi:GNAT superfamily N-acetyltransferase
VPPQVQLLPADAASDEPLVAAIARVINDAYAAGEDGLWQPGTLRTSSDEVAAAIVAGEMLVARVDGEVAACGRVRPLDADTADLGFVSVVPDHWGGGLGGEIVAAAEELVRSQGRETMQLELLVPRGWVHPHKDRLRAWYTRLGYRTVRTAPFEEIATHAASQLTTPCEFLVFRKSLGQARPEARTG